MKVAIATLSAVIGTCIVSGIALSSPWFGLLLAIVALVASHFVAKGKLSTLKRPRLVGYGVAAGATILIGSFIGFAGLSRDKERRAEAAQLQKNEQRKKQLQEAEVRKRADNDRLLASAPTIIKNAEPQVQQAEGVFKRKDYTQAQRLAENATRVLGSLAGLRGAPSEAKVLNQRAERVGESSKAYLAARQAITRAKNALKEKHLDADAAETAYQDALHELAALDSIPDKALEKTVGRLKQSLDKRVQSVASEAAEIRVDKKIVERKLTRISMKRLLAAFRANEMTAKKLSVDFGTKPCLEAEAASEDTSAPAPRLLFVRDRARSEGPKTYGQILRGSSEDECRVRAKRSSWAPSGKGCFRDSANG